MTELLLAQASSPLPNMSRIIRGIVGGSFSLLPGSAAEFINGLGGFIGVLSVIYSIFSVLILCYFGYCAFKIVLSIQGFIGGAAVGALIGIVMAVRSMTFDSIGAYAFIGALIVGIIGCVLASLLYKLGVFMFFSSGTFVIVTLYIALGFGGGWSTAMTAGIIAGFVVGIAAVIADKYFVIAGTAAVGAFNGGLMIMMSSNGAVGSIVTAALLVSGIIVQVKFTQKLGRRIKDGGKRAQAAPGGFAPNFGTPAYSTPNYAAPASAVPAYSTSCAAAPVSAPAMTALRCPNCGSFSEPGERFCCSCGRPLN